MLHKIFHLKLFFDFLEYCEACFRGFAFFVPLVYIFLKMQLEFICHIKVFLITLLPL